MFESRRESGCDSRLFQLPYNCPGRRCPPGLVRARNTVTIIPLLTESHGKLFVPIGFGCGSLSVQASIQLSITTAVPATQIGMIPIVILQRGDVTLSESHKDTSSATPISGSAASPLRAQLDRETCGCATRMESSRGLSTNKSESSTLC